MTQDNTPLDAVQNYLNWLENPETAVDQEAIESARRRFLAEADPLARLHAAADLESAKTTDTDQIVNDFIANARGYADAEGIPVEAFQALKVPDEVLEKAGFTLPPTKRGGGRGRRGRRSMRPSVTTGQLKSTVPSMPETFTLAQLADAAGGGAPGTVKKAIEEMISAGEVERVGPDPDHDGRGRAPVLYRRL